MYDYWSIFRFILALDIFIVVWECRYTKCTSQLLGAFACFSHFLKCSASYTWLFSLVTSTLVGLQSYWSLHSLFFVTANNWLALGQSLIMWLELQKCMESNLTHCKGTNMLLLSKSCCTRGYHIIWCAQGFHIEIPQDHWVVRIWILRQYGIHQNALLCNERIEATSRLDLC